MLGSDESEMVSALVSTIVDMIPNDFKKLLYIIRIFSGKTCGEFGGAHSNKLNLMVSS